MSKHKGITPEKYAEAMKLGGNYRQAARILGCNESSVRRMVQQIEEVEKLTDLSYKTDVPERTGQDAWDSHIGAFEARVSKIIKGRWPVIQRGSGAYMVAHLTDQHLDDDAVPLYLIADDIKRSHAHDAIMVHGGDVLNNWPLAGRLAQEWANQNCTKSDGLLRAQYFFELMKPDVAVLGNHEAFNPYLDDLLKSFMPKTTIQGAWTANFLIKSTGGRDLRAIVSHKFQKGGSWFHKAHGHIREMLEGEEADLLMDGHLHSDGVLDHTLPERGHAALCVATAGYKLYDKYAERISKGGKIPKLRGRAHWIVVDPQAGFDMNFCTAFKDPDQAGAYMNGLQNLRAV